MWKILLYIEYKLSLHENGWRLIFENSCIILAKHPALLFHRILLFHKHILLFHFRYQYFIQSSTKRNKNIVYYVEKQSSCTLFWKTPSNFRIHFREGVLNHDSSISIQMRRVTNTPFCLCNK